MGLISAATDMSIQESGNEVLIWLSEQELASLPSSAYWNDEAEEEGKAYHIEVGSVDTLWKYLRESTTYYDQYETVLRMARSLGLSIQGIGVDVAAGVCWTTALMSRLDAVGKLYAVEISKHRLLKLAPQVCGALDAVSEKITRVLGSFYDIRLPDASVDFALLSQAFHHADSPRRLLTELHRLLKPGAPVLVIGETPIFPSGLLKQRLKNLLKMAAPASLYSTRPVYKLWPTFGELFPPDRKAGDHYYRIDDYVRFFEECGFGLHQRRMGRDTVLVAIKRESEER